MITASLSVNKGLGLGPIGFSPIRISQEQRNTQRFKSDGCAYLVRIYIYIYISLSLYQILRESTDMMT